jgi:hypothetical protein
MSDFSRARNRMINGRILCNSPSPCWLLSVGRMTA